MDQHSTFRRLPVLALWCMLAMSCMLAAATPAQAQSEAQYYPVGRFSVAAPDYESQYTTGIAQGLVRTVIKHHFLMTNVQGDFKVAITYMDLGAIPDQAQTDAIFAELFEDTAAGPLADGSATLLAQERDTWQAYPALEFALQLETPSGSGWLKVRAVIADTRLYVLKASAPDPGTCDRVLQSFWVAP